MPPVDPRAETLRLLTSMDASLRAISIALVRILDAQGDREEGVTRPSAADDRLCDGPHGDPVIRAKDPKDWMGDTMLGRKLSECPPEYLELLASRASDYFVRKNTDALNELGPSGDPAEIAKLEKNIKYAKLDARRARAWAARKRAGWTAPVPTGGFHDDAPGF